MNGRVVNRRPVKMVLRRSLELNLSANTRDSFRSVLAITLSMCGCSVASDLISAPGRHSMMSETLNSIKFNQSERMRRGRKREGEEGNSDGGRKRYLTGDISTLL